MRQVIPKEEVKVSIDYPPTKVCDYCDSGFTYEFEDIGRRQEVVMGVLCEGYFVICPNCNNLVCITPFKPVKGENK